MRAKAAAVLCLLSCACASALCAPRAAAQARGGPALDVKVVTDEADAALAILSKAREGREDTVGWRMGALIEKTYGRRALVGAMCERRGLLETYNRAAALHNRGSRAPLALWSHELLAASGGAPR